MGGGSEIFGLLAPARISCHLTTKDCPHFHGIYETKQSLANRLILKFMEAQSFQIINTKRLTWLVFVAAMLWLTGCETSEHNPLAGWMFRPFPGWGANPNGHSDNTLTKLITEDYQDFITKRKLSLAGAITGFYEDRAGQHAIRFDIFLPHQNATMTYVLIYDKDNRRIKVIKFGYRKYQS